jgi:hypothetical protein
VNPFEQYAKKANTIVSQPPKLLGPNKTRADARARYDSIVSELTAMRTLLALEEYLEIIRDEIAQFRAELEFYWEGEGDFLGLQKEIERAQVRLDAGLDIPRWEPGYSNQEQGTE